MREMNNSKVLLDDDVVTEPPECVDVCFVDFYIPSHHKTMLRLAFKATVSLAVDLISITAHHPPS